MATVKSNTDFLMRGYKTVARICVTIDVLQFLFMSLYYCIMASYSWPTPNTREYLLSPNDVEYPLSDDTTIVDWVASVLVMTLQVFILWLGILKLYYSTRSNISYQEWTESTNFWMKAQFCFVLVDILATFGSSLKFYVPSSVLSYTLTVHFFSFSLMVLYKIMQENACE